MDLLYQQTGWYVELICLAPFNWVPYTMNGQVQWIQRLDGPFSSVAQNVTQNVKRVHLSMFFGDENQNPKRMRHFVKEVIYHPILFD